MIDIKLSGCPVEICCTHTVPLFNISPHLITVLSKHLHLFVADIIENMKIPRHRLVKGVHSGLGRDNSFIWTADLELGEILKINCFPISCFDLNRITI